MDLFSFEQLQREKWLTAESTSDNPQS